VSGIGRRLIPFFLACAVIALVAVGVAWAETPAINKAKSQADALREQIDELDAQVEAAVEEYNTANAQLDQTQAAAKENEKKLAVVEADLEEARVRLTDRIVEIYKEGHLGMLDTLVGSASFSDLINRLSLMERLSKQDSDLVARVTAYEEEVTARKAELAKQIEDEKQYTADAAVAERKVEAQLAAKEKALKGKEAQIAQLEKEEAERQAALAAAAKKAAEEARKAREAAAAAAAATTTTTHRTTTTTHATTTSGHTSTTERGTATTERTTATTERSTTTSERTTTTDDATTTTARATTTTTDPPSSGGTSGGDVVDYALQFLGTSYVWAGSTPSGFDCSGFTMYVYRHFGIYLPHSSSMQSGYGTAVSRADLQPGDLVFFYSPIHHVGLYIGGGKMVNAAGTGKGVRIDYIWSSYNCGRRILR
jgi:peptidoglycan DL-endopeptidase CwlO